MQSVNNQPYSTDTSTPVIPAMRRVSTERAATLAFAGFGMAIGSLINAGINRVAMKRTKHRALFRARLASATLGRSLGAVAAGIFAIGATATGAIAIGALAIGKMKIKDLDIERLRVRNLVEGAVPLRMASVSPSV